MNEIRNEFNQTNTTSYFSSTVQYLNEKYTNVVESSLHHLNELNLGILRTSVKVLRYCKLSSTASVVGTVFSEPLTTLKAAYSFSEGRKENFNPHNVNPTELNDNQINQRPVLLIHGSKSNQSTWIDLAENFKKNNLEPIFTINLPDNSFSDSNLTAAEKKVQEIVDLYKRYGNENVTVDLVGHSLGGTIIYFLSFKSLIEDNPNLRNSKIISIGNVFSESHIRSIETGDPNFRTRLFEITGSRDVLSRGTPSTLAEDHRKEINTGHLGLLYSSEAHDHIIEILKNRN